MVLLIAGRGSTVAVGVGVTGSLRQRLPIELNGGKNEIVVRVRGGVSSHVLSELANLFRGQIAWHNS